MSRRAFLEYEIRGEGVHCLIDIYINDFKIITLDTDTKYVESAEEDLAKMIKEKMFGGFIDHKEEDEDDEDYTWV